MRSPRLRERFAQRGLPGEIRQVDARQLPFADAAFDYAYSWGVLHHSPNLGQSVAELMRVLAPAASSASCSTTGTRCCTWYHILYLEGVLHAERRFLSPLQLASRYTDGDRQEGNPGLRPVTAGERRARYSARTRPGSACRSSALISCRSSAWSCPESSRSSPQPCGSRGRGAGGGASGSAGARLMRGVFMPPARGSADVRLRRHRRVR